MKYILPLIIVKGVFLVQYTSKSQNRAFIDSLISLNNDLSVINFDIDNNNILQRRNKNPSNNGLDVNHSILQKRSVISNNNRELVYYGKLYAKYSAAAYCPEDQIVSWKCLNCEKHLGGLNVTAVFKNNEYNTYGYIGYNDLMKKIIISYRGTENVENWLANLKIWMTYYNTTDAKYSNAKIHTGFKLMTDSIYNYTAKELSLLRSKYKDYQVAVVGHSLGGAIASLVALRLGEDKIIEYEDIHLFTYGQPRVGNTRFAEYFYSKHMRVNRITNDYDIVPRTPSGWFSYIHYPKEYYIKENKYTLKCNDTASVEDISCLSGRYLASIKAHFNFWNYEIASDC